MTDDSTRHLELDLTTQTRVTLTVGGRTVVIVLTRAPDRGTARLGITGPLDVAVVRSELLKKGEAK